jgi:hypothetical protein
MAWKLCDPIRAGEIVVFDRAYVDFEHLYHLQRKSVVWVTRSKENMCYEIMGQQLSEEEIQQARHMREAGIFVGQLPIVLSDNLVMLARGNTFEKYPETLRLVTSWVLRDGKPAEMSFITNQLEWSPYSICDLYLARWGIEVFFKEIKQTAPARRFPRDERKRHQVADMDRLARLSAPAPHSMAGRLGKVVPQTFYPRQGDALESTEPSGFVQACRGGRKRRVAAGQTVRRSVAVRLRRHLNRKPNI